MSVVPVDVVEKATSIIAEVGACDDDWFTLTPEWDLNIWGGENATLYPVKEGYTITHTGYSLVESQVVAEVEEPEINEEGDVDDWLDLFDLED